jgi:hypothetical protein
VGKTVAIVQSNYIPWKGYFDLINAVDEFVLFDDVQYTRRDWRNRNRIKSRTGPVWLTIPVNSTGLYDAPISAMHATDERWRERHWKTICANYAHAEYFSRYAQEFEYLYVGSHETRLSAINRSWIEAICALLGVNTRLSWSSDYRRVTGKTERLVSICEQIGADAYLSGPSARAYVEIERFEAAGIQVVYYDYSGYPEYRQLFPPFDHHVSILDLILNEGPEATRYMLSF